MTTATNRIAGTGTGGAFELPGILRRCQVTHPTRQRSSCHTLMTTPHDQPQPAPPLLLVPENALSVRSAHLRHESLIKSFALLYLLPGPMFLLSAIGWAVAGDEPSAALRIPIAALCFSFGTLLLWTGSGLRKLDKRARTAATILACIGLLGVPIGTIINGCLLYLLLSQKGSMIFADEYKAVVAATPQMNYRTPIIVWISIGIFWLLLLSGTVWVVIQALVGQ